MKCAVILALHTGDHQVISPEKITAFTQYAVIHVPHRETTLPASAMCFQGIHEARQSQYRFLSIPAADIENLRQVRERAMQRGRGLKRHLLLLQSIRTCDSLVRTIAKVLGDAGNKDAGQGPLLSTPPPRARLFESKNAANISSRHMGSPVIDEHRLISRDAPVNRVSPPSSLSRTAMLSDGELPGNSAESDFLSSALSMVAMQQVCASSCPGVSC